MTKSKARLRKEPVEKVEEFLSKVGQKAKEPDPGSGLVVVERKGRVSDRVEDQKDPK